MEKYIVRVYILKSNKNGKMDSQDFEYSFQDPKLIIARNNAIAKVKELEYSFSNESTIKNKFSSPLEAQMKDFKNFNAYSIELSFVPEKDFEYQIYGEEELTIESLEVEARYYDGNNQSICEIEDLNGEIVEVLQSDLEFLLK
jgi:hypothetical protein